MSSVPPSIIGVSPAQESLEDTGGVRSRSFGPGQPAVARPRSGCRPLYPAGAIAAVSLAAIIHLLAAAVYPEPVARAGLREKTRALSAGNQASLIVAGDSAFQCGVLPDLLAAKLELPSAKVINMAESACDTPAFMAAYREFEARFARPHTVVLNVSSFAANDAARGLVGQELLWSLGLTDRLQVAGAGRALAGYLLPEESLWKRCLNSGTRAAIAYPRQGFGARFAGDHLGNRSPAELQADIERYHSLWYPDLQFEGIRWARLQQDVRTLARGNAGLVVVLMPFHPTYVAALDKTPAGAAEREFRDRIQRLCRELGVPCLRYEAAWCGTTSPDPLFRDVMHFTRRGAELFTTRLAKDLIELKAE